MKRLHYPLLALLVLAIVGFPTWYSVRGQGAEAVPGAGQKEVLRSNSGRTYVGGGPRVGK
ncbi:MAG: hypothetical protein AAF404_00625 [Pseudomonadota bacterium]